MRNETKRFERMKGIKDNDVDTIRHPRHRKELSRASVTVNPHSQKGVYNCVYCTANGVVGGRGRSCKELDRSKGSRRSGRDEVVNLIILII